jgi:hypothetical protein
MKNTRDGRTVYIVVRMDVEEHENLYATLDRGKAEQYITDHPLGKMEWLWSYDIEEMELM